MVLFKDESSVDPKAHPAQMVLDHLCGPCPEANALHAKQMAQWFKDYASRRGQPHLYKESVEPGLETNL